MGNTPPHGNAKRHYGDSNFHSFVGSGHSPFTGISIPPPKKRNLRRILSGPDDRNIDPRSLPSSDMDINNVTSLFKNTNLDSDWSFSNYKADSHNCVFNSNIENAEKINEHDVPTVFRWKGGGKTIAISGTFNNWTSKIAMVKRNSGACIIIDCPPGRHEYKYFIDGAWYHDPTKPAVENRFGTKNNVIEVKPEDYDVLTALEQDIANSKHQSDETITYDSSGSSPPGEYAQIIPSDPELSTEDPYKYSMVQSAHKVHPPMLPSQLLHGLLNKDTELRCDPNLLPSPNHVMLNHLYALSIKNGVVVLSVISRYRQKFVSTLFYKPIQD